MATPNPSSTQSGGQSLYDVLGLAVNATEQEVGRAFRQRALHSHPDKVSGASSETWLLLLKARDIFTDREKRADYDRLLRKSTKIKVSSQKATEPLLKLHDGFRLSSTFHVWYKQWLTMGKTVKFGLFPQSLANSLSRFLEGPLAKMYSEPAKQRTVQPPRAEATKQRAGTTSPCSETTRIRQGRTSHRGHSCTQRGPEEDWVVIETTPLEEENTEVAIEPVYNFSYDQLTEVVEKTINDPACGQVMQNMQQALKGIIELARRSKNSLSQAQVSNTQSGKVPILDMSSVPTESLLFLLRLFTAQLQQNAQRTRTQLLDQMLMFIPQKDMNTSTVNIPNQSTCTACRTQFKFFRRAKYQCYSCRSNFCSNCPTKELKMVRAGVWEVKQVCNECDSQFMYADTQSWIAQATELVQNHTEEDTHAALVCALMATCSFNNLEFSLLHRFVRVLSDNYLPELAVAFLSILSKEAETPQEQVQVCLTTSSTLEALAYSTDIGSKESYLLLQAAKEALDRASDARVSTVEIAHLSTYETRISESLHMLEENKKYFAEKEVQHALCDLEMAWSCRDFKKMLTIITEHRETYKATEENEIKQALLQFVATKQVNASRMHEQDSSALAFFQGLVKIYDGRITDGLVDIQISLWALHHFTWVTKPAVEIAVTLLSKSSESLDFAKSVQRACEKVIDQVSSRGTRALANINTDGLFSCLHVTTEDVFPPTKVHWPTLNSNEIQTFEDAVLEQVNRGKMTYREAALAYADYTIRCQHPAERTICFLIAGQWFLKELESMRDGGVQSPSEVFATKEAALFYLTQALAVSCLSLHPAMRMYTARVALGTALTVTQLASNYTIPKDAKLIVDLLDTVVHSVRFCPFWKYPVVMVSEGVILWLVVSRLHSEFMVQLQNVPEEQCPVRQAELHYQLYENDLRGVCTLAEPSAALEQAMEKMLEEKGWSWRDVSQTMSSSLSLRTPDGWLQPQPTFNVPMEYAELKGFVIKVDEHPFVELLVTRASTHSQRGLFSRNDVDTILQLENNDWENKPIFLSLDPPNSKEQFHPFQEVRFHPQKLQNTDYLQTLFETDYLVKTFSIGSDTSAKPPFNQRPCSEGLTAGLPGHLQKAIRPIHERGHSQSRLNRFWIEVEELVYSENRIGPSTLQILFKDPRMVIKSHRLYHGTDGELRDMIDEDDPNSPEQQFATDMTKHYDELGKYFPMFARLKELCKLQLLDNVLESCQECVQNAYKNIRDRTLQHNVQEARGEKRLSIRKMLEQLRPHIDAWPAAEDEATIEREMTANRDRIKREYNIPDWNTCQDWEIDSMLQPKVIESLREQDNQLINRLMDECQNGASRVVLQDKVHRWINHNASSELEQYIFSCLPLRLTTEDVRRRGMQENRKVYNSFSRMCSDLRETAQRNQTGPSSRCNWVPAALFKSEENNTLSHSYGGVLLHPNLKEGRVPPLPRSTEAERITEAATCLHNDNPQHVKGDYRAPSQRSTRASDGDSSSDSGRAGSVGFQFGGKVDQASPPTPPTSSTARSNTLSSISTIARVGKKQIQMLLTAHGYATTHCRVYIGVSGASNFSTSTTANRARGSVGRGDSSRGRSRGGTSGPGAAGGGGRDDGDGGNGGGGGDDEDGGKGRFSLILLLAIGCYMHKILTKSRQSHLKEKYDMLPMRDENVQQRVRDNFAEANRNVDMKTVQVAHTLALQLVNDMIHVAYDRKAISTTPEDLQKYAKWLVNDERNFEVVPTQVSLCDHRKQDSNIMKVARGKEQLTPEAAQRVEDIRQFLSKIEDAHPDLMEAIYYYLESLVVSN